MKGIVFTEFLEMVESQYGLVMADKIVNENELDSGGAYTSVGTYNHTEMVQLVTNLSKETELSVGQLLEIYGRHFFSMATKNYKQFFNTITSSFEFLSGIENHIHVEVLKLYPDAELPRFEISQPSKDKLVMVYYSERRLSDFAKGLIIACIDYYKEDISLFTNKLASDGHIVEFTLIKK